MVKKTFLILLLILFSCGNNPTEPDPCSDCDINVYCELPQDENGVYLLQWNQSLVQTYTTVYVETNCGLHTRVSWDTNYRYNIGGQYVRLINNSSMTDENGDGRIIFGVWEPFIGYTITCYGGYVDECENHYVDSLRIKILG